MYFLLLLVVAFTAGCATQKEPKPPDYGEDRSEQDEDNRFFYGSWLPQRSVGTPEERSAFDRAAE